MQKSARIGLVMLVWSLAAAMAGCGGEEDGAAAGEPEMMAPSSPEVCGDRLDNDLDGAVDCSDADCIDDPGCVIVPDSETQCADGEDEDQDSLTDCDDEDCAEDEACVDPEVCDDEVDNDGDGAIDCADADCEGAGVCEIAECVAVCGAILQCRDIRELCPLGFVPILTERCHEACEGKDERTAILGKVNRGCTEVVEEILEDLDPEGVCAGEEVCDVLATEGDLPGTVMGVTEGRGLSEGSCGGGGSPEVFYALTPEADATYCAEVTGAEDFLPVVYVREAECFDVAEAACSAEGPLEFDAAGGVALFIFVDGVEGAEGSYSLTVREGACE